MWIFLRIILFGKRSLIKIKVASKKDLFLFSSKLESPYKRISFLTLPEDGSKLSDTDFTLFLRSL